MRVAGVGGGGGVLDGFSDFQRSGKSGCGAGYSRIQGARSRIRV